jgi:hypothetical protein
VSDRAGNEDRKFHAEVITQGYMAGYLDDLELQERLDKASTARHMTDLRALVSDIPAVPAKQKKSHVSLNPRSMYKQLNDAWKGLVWGITALVSLLCMVVTIVYDMNTHAPHHLGLSGALEMLLALGLGIPAVIGFAIRAVWCTIEGTY